MSFNLNRNIFLKFLIAKRTRFVFISDSVYTFSDLLFFYSSDLLDLFFLLLNGSKSDSGSSVKSFYVLITLDILSYSVYFCRNNITCLVNSNVFRKYCLRNTDLLTMYERNDGY